ncbi:MAG: gamma-glutamyltransferase [Bacteroidota bacterium]
MNKAAKIILFVILILPAIILSKSKDPVRAKNGMVVSASEIASMVGVQILEKGGNAIDAAVATGFALAVAYPQAGNIGGGGFMVIHFANGSSTSIDYREKAPRSAFRDMYLNENGEFDITQSTSGWSSSGVPGSVDGMLYALENYGTMELQEVLEPAINLAETGFPIDYRFADVLNNYKLQFIKNEAAKKIFTSEFDKFIGGDLFIQTDLAYTLSLIAKYGREGFYDGSVAKLIAKQSSENGGYITLEDIKNYRSKERDPVYGKYRGYEIISMGPPSSGGIVLIETLNALENFIIDKKDWGSSKYIHIVSEILKYVYADRSKHLGDEDFYHVPKEWILSKERGKEIASKISKYAKPSLEIYPGSPLPNESDETTHYNVVDSRGNMVSVTTTLNSTFGNKIVVDGAGFLLNNEMDDFSGKPGVPNQFGLLGGEANAIESNKRMLSAMTPTIILDKDDDPFMLIGSPGGATIITTVLQVILNVIEFEMDIQTAIDMPRFHHQWMPDQIDYEPFGMSEDVRNNLVEIGHNLGTIGYMGRAEGIIIDKKSGLFWGASDPRGYGKAVGY